MATKPEQKISISDVQDKIDRAKALAFVLGDAAASDMGVEPENVHRVAHVIAEMLEECKRDLERYHGQAERAEMSRKQEAA